MRSKQLLKIAKDFGGPVYIYDSEKIKDQYKKLEIAFKSVKNLSINYISVGDLTKNIKAVDFSLLLKN